MNKVVLSAFGSSRPTKQTSAFVGHPSSALVGQSSSAFVGHPSSAFVGRTLSASLGHNTLRKDCDFRGKPKRNYNQFNANQTQLRKRNSPFRKTRAYRAIHAVRESNDDDMQKIVSYLSGLLSVYALPATFITGFVSSIVTMISAIMAYKTVNKSRSALAKTLLISSVITVISNVLTAIAAFFTADFEGVDLEIPKLARHVVNEVVQQQEVIPDDQVNLPEKARTFLKEIENLGLTDPCDINAYYRRKYSFLDFNLPNNQAPIKTCPAIRLAALSFDWPDSFLQKWWDLDERTMFGYRHLYKTAKTSYTGLENIWDDNKYGNKVSDDVELPPSPNAGTSVSYESPKETDGEHPVRSDLVQESFEDINQDSILAFARAIFSKVVCMAAYIGDCVFTKKKFSVTDLLMSTKKAEDLEKASFEFNECVKILCNEPTLQSSLEEEARRFTEAFSTFLEQPTHVLARSLNKIAEITVTIKDYEQWQRRLLPKNQQQFLGLQGLYTSASKKRVSFLTNEMPTLERQEPFVVLFRGSNGVGKTMLSSEMAARTAEQVLHLSPRDACVDITPSDKYWPPLGGMKDIYKFDEVCSSQSISKDLLFGNMKGICSPAFFNCAAADVEHKINPCTAKIIFATSNTSFAEMASRVASESDAESWAAYCRRMIVVDCETKFVNYDPSHPEKFTFDSENFTHMTMTLMKYSGGKLVTDQVVTPKQLLQLISERHNRMVSKHHTALERMNLKREASVSHYSIVMHGQAGQGKSYALEHVSRRMAVSLNMPIVQITTESALVNLPRQTRRVIVCIDDIVRNISNPIVENAFMDMYNSKLIPSSIIISTTNVSPRLALPKFGGTHLIENRHLSFQNEGLARRMGFVGSIDSNYLPTYNDELYVSNQMYAIKHFNAAFDLAKLNSPHIFLALAAMILLFYFTSLSILVFALYIAYQGKDLIFSPPLAIKSMVELPEYFFTRYNNFLQAERDIPIVYDTFTNQGDYNFILLSQTSEEVVMTVDPMEYDAHVFCTKANFDKYNDGWKLYVSPQVFRELGKNYHKYMLPCQGFTLELILSIVRKYVNALIDSGITPTMYVDIGDIGRLEFRNGKITADLVRDQNPCAISIVNTEIESLLLFNEHIIPFARIIQNPNMAAELNLSFADAAAFNSYINSDAFISTVEYQRTARALAQEEISNIALANAKIVRDKIKAWSQHPIGRIVLACIAILGIVGFFWALIKMLKPKHDQERRRVSRKGNSKSRPYDSDADKRVRQDADSSSDEDDYLERKKAARKGNPKSRPFDSDDDHKPRHQDLDLERKKSRKGSPKSKAYDSDDDKKNAKREDVLTLADMNDFDSLKPYIDAVHRESRANLCQVYREISDKSILPHEPVGNQSCYGLFIKGTMFVTVGHAVPSSPSTNIYVGSDEFEGFHKAQMLHRYSTRDISVWHVPTLERVKNYRDISKRFLSTNDTTDDSCFNAILQRFGPEKAVEFHTGELTVFRTPEFFSKDVGRLGDYGQMLFGTFGVKLTTFGDCGLPYMMFEPKPMYLNKLLGIHCMGNPPGHTSVGVAALVFKEDVDRWTAMYKAQKSPQKEAIDVIPECCEFAVDKITPKLDDNPKCPGHITVWHPNHKSTISTFVDEVMHILNERPNFKGVIVKNSGLLMGTQEHSHTQFLPKERLNDFTKAHAWLKATTDVLKIDRCPGDDVYYRKTVIPISSFASHITKMNDMCNDFRFRCEVYTDPRTSRLMIKIEQYFLAKTIIRTKQESLTLRETISFIAETKKVASAIELPLSGRPVYVSSDVKSIIDTASLNLQRGTLEDVPFRDILDNQTVKVFGAFKQDKSHIPKNHYHLSPFSVLVSDLIPIEKKPCCFDPNLTPPEQLEKLPLDNFGQRSHRVAQSIQWAHEQFTLGKELTKRINAEFYEKILRFYSDLRVMTDEEVLAGLSANDPDRHYFKGMELDTSIGFTMKELYNVSKKSDVIACNDKGLYIWKDNDASRFLQEEYELAKQLSMEGKQYFVAYLELLKMEKLKLSKIYTGRTFVVQDILGVLMERRNLGYISVRAMKSDPNCGVGVDPTKHFHQLYVRLAQHPNIWAGDYARFDKTEPAFVFTQLKDMLARANPHMANEIRASFDAIIYRTQVSGSTLAEVNGGMPSGCTLTAPLNSLVNEYLLFACYVILMESQNLVYSWDHYILNIERLFYGDDVLLSVSDELAEIFTRDRVSLVMQENFGMFLDSAAKDGTVATFDDWITASWISRSFRKIDEFPYIVGALKKISIGANFHYVTSVDLSHIGSLMTKALYEAAFWEEDYYRTILKAINRCIDNKPALSKHVIITDRLRIQREAYEAALPAISGKEKERLIKPLVATESVRTATKIYSEIKKNRRYRETLAPLLQSLINFDPESLKDFRMSYRSKINEAYQSGKIQKPDFKYTPFDGVDPWKCSFILKVDDLELIMTGYGFSKATACEAACFDAWQHLPCIPQQRINLATFERQMNIAPQTVGKVPSAPFLQSDVSVVPDAGLYTNTGAPAIATDSNQLGIALDNPAGTGAPFSKHTSCYQVYQNWDEKSVSISPALAAGTEIFRLSLDPNDLPNRLKEYILFHDSLIPALDIVVAIAGAAGSIGWIKSGWVKDASPSKKYTSADLQQVESKVTNMNGTQILRFTLHDVRRQGLYRLTKDDPEPYPGIVFLVEHAVTNVQRNDNVNYPVRVQVRLHPSCVLMEPFSSPGSNPVTTNFPLGTYFYDTGVDMLVLSSSVPNDPEPKSTWEDDGFNSKAFEPKFDAKNIIGAIVHPDAFKNKACICVTIREEASADLYTLLTGRGYDTFASKTNPPVSYFFAYGTVPIDSFGTDDLEYVPPGASTYKADYKITVGAVQYGDAIVYAYPRGCIIKLTAKYEYREQDDSNGKPGKWLIFYNGQPHELVWYRSEEEVRGLAIYDDKTEAFGNSVTCYMMYGNPLQPFSVQKNPETLKVEALPKVFTLTGNAAPSSQLPTGLKELTFVRSGTTTTLADDTPAVVLAKPVLNGALSALQSLLTQLNRPALTANLVIDDEVIGAVGFTDGTLIVRTDDFKMIKPSVGTNIVLTNVTGVTDLKTITQFNTKGLNTWITKGLRTRAKRFDLSNFVKEAAMAGAAGMQAGGAFLSTLGSGLFNIWDQNRRMDFAREMQDKLLANNRLLQDANNEALSQRQKDAFERQQQLTGYSSASARYGLGLDSYNNDFIYSHVFQPTDPNRRAPSEGGTTISGGDVMTDGFTPSDPQRHGPTGENVMNDTTFRNTTSATGEQSNEPRQSGSGEGTEPKGNSEALNFLAPEEQVVTPAKQIYTAQKVTNAQAPEYLAPEEQVITPATKIYAAQKVTNAQTN